MRLAQEPTARPESALKGRWSEYTQLSRQIKQAGLLERRHGWYAAKIGLNLALLAAGGRPSPSWEIPGGSWSSPPTWQSSSPKARSSAMTPATGRSTGPGAPTTWSAWCMPTWGSG